MKTSHIDANRQAHLCFESKKVFCRETAKANTHDRVWFPQETADGELVVFHDATLDRALPEGRDINAAPMAAFRQKVQQSAAPSETA